MRHYREIKLEKDNQTDLREVLIALSKNIPNGWFVNSNLVDDFIKDKDISHADIMCFLSPYYTHIISKEEKKVFRGKIFFGIRENNLIVFDIIEQFDEIKLPVHLYNYALQNFLKEVIMPNSELLKGYQIKTALKKEKPTIPRRKELEASKKSLVISTTPTKYKIFDKRVKKPIHFVAPDKSGEMLLQEADDLEFEKNKKITFFTPNNISLLLSTSEKALLNAKEIYNKFGGEDANTNPVEFVKLTTSLVCDYIENIQTAIIFSYSALESFVNLSIPDDYEYYKIQSDSGVAYEKKYIRDSIERLIPLKEKLIKVLPDIYDTEPIEKEDFLNKFSILENLRNKIIHQKSIESTELYKDYFKESIFQLCQISVDIINFFYENCQHHFSTNPIWPWTEGKEHLFPKAIFDSKRFEVLGNIENNNSA
jgi:hypothetical protein